MLLHLYPGVNIDAERALRFLEGLREMIAGPVLLVWDNIKFHHAKTVQRYIRDNQDWLEVLYLPAYSPQLNPIEYLWSSWKRTYLANLCLSDASALCDVLIDNEAGATDQALLKGCLRASGLVTKDETPA